MRGHIARRAAVTAALAAGAIGVVAGSAQAADITPIPIPGTTTSITPIPIPRVAITPIPIPSTALQSLLTPKLPPALPPGGGVGPVSG